MKVNNVALSGSPSVTVETKLRCLLFQFTSASTSFANFLTAYAACTVEVVKQTANGQQQILPVRNITDLMEIAASDTGAISAITNGAGRIVTGSIELSDFGALDLDGNDFYKVTVTGIPAGDTLDIYAEDSHINANGWHNVYETIFCNANAAKTINVLTSKLLALPVATLSKLELQYRNGRTIQFEIEEIKNQCREVNPEAVNENGIITAGFVKWFVLNVADVYSAKVTLSAAGTVIKKDYVQL